MTQREQQVAFEADLNNLIRRYVQEFNLSAASAVGVLQIVAAGIISAVAEDDPE